MIVVIELPALIAAAVIAVAGVVTNRGSTQPLSDNMVISGPRRGTAVLLVRRDRLTREPAGSGQVPVPNSGSA